MVKVIAGRHVGLERSGNPTKTHGIQILCKDLEGSFMLVGDAEIPLHRIKQVRKKSKLIWQR